MFIIIQLVLIIDVDCNLLFSPSAISSSLLQLIHWWCHRTVQTSWIFHYLQHDSLSCFVSFYIIYLTWSAMSNQPDPNGKLDLVKKVFGSSTATPVKKKIPLILLQWTRQVSWDCSSESVECSIQVSGQQRIARQQESQQRILSILRTLKQALYLKVKMDHQVTQKVVESITHGLYSISCLLLPHCTS